MPNIQQIHNHTELDKTVRKAMCGRDDYWKPGEWAYFSNLPGTVRIKEVFFPYYIKALYLVEFQSNEYWAYHHELE